MSTTFLSGSRVASSKAMLRELGHRPWGCRTASLCETKIWEIYKYKYNIYIYISIYIYVDIYIYNIIFLGCF